ncbi:MAG: FKBP-type peptidyl-prolyl cis-trans isomerase [Desulfuromonadales bacterium]|nr:FKBP-type peptidyl-prolyl cis-trans isomerase [Desulfuromonadales bacterium]
MQRAELGDMVTVHYIGTLDNGRIFDQRDEDQPLSFTLGNDEVFPALEEAVVGMKPGEVRNIHLRAEQAYGMRREENLLKVQRSLFPAEKELRIGQKLKLELGDGTHRVMRIRTVAEREVLLDGNHDLAGCDLTFALKLVSIGSGAGLPSVHGRVKEEPPLTP